MHFLQLCANRFLLSLIAIVTVNLEIYYEKQVSGFIRNIIEYSVSIGQFIDVIVIF